MDPPFLHIECFLLERAYCNCSLKQAAFPAILAARNIPWTLDRPLGLRLDIKTHAPRLLNGLEGAALRFAEVYEHFTVFCFSCFPCFHCKLLLLFVNCCWILSCACTLVRASPWKPYIDCRQFLSSVSISKRTPQDSGSVLKALAGAVPTRTNTFLLSILFENQSPFLPFMMNQSFLKQFMFQLHPSKSKNDAKDEYCYIVIAFKWNSKGG